MAQSVKRERTFADLMSKGVNPMYLGIQNQPNYYEQYEVV